jgi:hypothetical protein
VPRASSVRFGIVGVGAAHPELLGVMTNVGSRLHVELRDISNRGRSLTAGDTPPLQLLPGYHRDIGLASWSGATPDLIVVDRSNIAPVMRVRVFSASTAFRQPVLDVLVGKAAFPATAFSVLIGSVSSPGADLTLVSRTPTATAHTEVHVLLGSDAFQEYIEPSPVNLRAAVPFTIPFLLTHDGVKPVIAVINRAAGVLEIVNIT